MTRRTRKALTKSVRREMELRWRPPGPWTPSATRSRVASPTPVSMTPRSGDSSVGDAERQEEVDLGKARPQESEALDVSEYVLLLSRSPAQRRGGSQRLETTVDQGAAEVWHLHTLEYRVRSSAGSCKGAKCCTASGSICAKGGPVQRG